MSVTFEPPCFIIMNFCIIKDQTQSAKSSVLYEMSSSEEQERDNMSLSLSAEQPDLGPETTQACVLNEERDAQIKFYERPHVYLIDGKRAKTSVSSYISAFFNPFPRERFDAYRLSTFNFKALIGTIAHALIQADLEETEPPMKYVLSTEPHEPYHEPSLTKSQQEKFYEEYPYKVAIERGQSHFKTFRRFKNVFLQNWKFLAAEYMIWTKIKDDSILAGCIDAMFWDGDPSDRNVIIVDWKTNNTLAPYLYEKPISLESSPFRSQIKGTLDKYMCQLHLYAHILEKEYNVSVTSAFIVHLTPQMNYHIIEVNNLGGNCPCTKKI